MLHFFESIERVTNNILKPFNERIGNSGCMMAASAVIGRRIMALGFAVSMIAMLSAPLIVSRTQMYFSDSIVRFLNEIASAEMPHAATWRRVRAHMGVVNRA